MSANKRPNYRKQPCCGNCAHSHEDHDGAHFCNVAKDAPPEGSWSLGGRDFCIEWELKNLVFPGAVCDAWQPGEENLP